jgi:hypothetical protein
MLGGTTTQGIADDAPILTRNDFGEVGLIEMPSARMVADGDLSANMSFSENTQHYNLGFQFFPWLETDFHYSGLNHFDFPAYPVYWDRAFSVKARLWDETEFVPAVAVGLNNVIGVSVFSSEYLVASKQFGDFDASVGIGWGRLGSANTFRNPLCAISQSFCERAVFSPNGGQFNFGQYFHGATAGIFGGVNWRTPIKDLTLQVELSSDSYQEERFYGSFDAKNELNFGASYQLTDATSIGLSYNYGETIAGRVTFDLDPVHSGYAQTISTPAPAASIRSPEEQQAALNQMLQKRKNSPLSPKEAEQQAAAIDRSGSLVDALFREEVSDFHVEGRDIFLVTNHPRLCDVYAKIIGAYEPNVDRVVILNSVRRSQCFVSSNSLLIRAHTVASSSLLLQTGPILIDAATNPQAPAGSLSEVTKVIKKDLASQKVDVDGLDLGTSDLTLYYSNGTYFSESEAIGRIIRVLMADAPPNIERFRLIGVYASLPQREFDVLRSPMERAISQNDVTALANDAIIGKAAPLFNPLLTESDFPKYSWWLYPQFRQELFDPSQPLGVMFVAVLGGNVELLRGLSMGGDVEGNLYNDFNLTRQSGSVLPHVRTDYNQYFTTGKNGIADLETAYEFRLTPTVFAAAKAGYLESMFAGVGGEILWRPEGQRWAIGADAYQVWQRGFDRLFDLQPYKAFTGHLTLYYESPWYNLNFIVRAGQYLAQDRGITFEITRRFSTGIEIGAYATKTNVSSAQYGEGSFDKGIVITIPLDWMLPVDTQTEYGTVLRETQRDGGQTLLGDATLYSQTQRSSEGEMQPHVDQLIAP